MAAFEVRVALPDDAERVTALLEASYPSLTAEAYETFAAMPEALELMTRAQPRLLACGTFYVAESEDARIVGCGGWTEWEPAEGRIRAGVAHIRHFATHPEWVRRGVGRALYERCERLAREAGMRTLECTSLLNAEPFYARLGFERIGLMRVEVRPGVAVPCVAMRKAIA